MGKDQRGEKRHPHQRGNDADRQHGAGQDRLGQDRGRRQDQGARQDRAGQEKALILAQKQPGDMRPDNADETPGLAALAQTHHWQTAATKAPGSRLILSNQQGQVVLEAYPAP